jgi:hypothetical protein
MALSFASVVRSFGHGIGEGLRYHDFAIHENRRKPAPRLEFHNFDTMIFCIVNEWYRSEFPGVWK